MEVAVAAVRWTTASSVRKGLDGILGERRAQQVAADPFEPSTVFPSTVVAACRCIPSIDTVRGGVAAGSGGAAKCGPPSASCTQARSAGSMSRSSSLSIAADVLDGGGPRSVATPLAGTGAGPSNRT